MLYYKTIYERNTSVSFWGEHVSTGNQHRGLRTIYFVTHGNKCEYVSLFGYFYGVISIRGFLFIQ